jgi:predicted permease
MSKQPPWLAEKLLEILIGTRDAEVIAGDLRESGGGRAWYWRQVASCLWVRLSPHRRIIPDLNRDLHYAFRILRRNPGYAATAMLCLALGVGVNTVVFSWLDEMYFRRLAVPNAHQMVAITRNAGPPCSWREFRDFFPSQSTAALIPKGTFLDIGNVNDQIYAEVVSANYFNVLNVPPALGRTFQPEEDSPTSAPVAVISDAAWQRHFHRDPNAIGKPIRIEDQWYRIVGVAPPSFRGASSPLAVDAWVPLATYPHYRSAGSNPGVQLIARTAPAELAIIDERMKQSDPGHKRFKNRIAVHPIAGYAWAEAQREWRPIALLLGAIVGIVLLIACANVANLLLARAAVRQHEMAIRRALGAGHGQLVRQGITEGLVLAAGGAVLGILLGIWANHAIAAFLPTAHPDLALQTVYLEVNGRVAAATAALALMSALLCSISPALANARGGRPQTAKRNALVIAQVALSFVLLVSAGLLLRALGEANGSDPGFATKNRIYLRLFTPDNDFTPAQATSLYSRLLDEARTHPGVKEATLSFAVFGFMDGDCASTNRAEAPRKLNINVIEPNYFNFVQTPLIRGRGLVASDLPGSPRVIVVNETMARRWWPGEDPIGKTAWLGCQTETRVPAEVIGVVRDSKYGSLDEKPLPFYFVHWRQVWWNGFFALMLHTAGDPHKAAEPLLTLARTGGANLRIYEMRTFDETLALSLFRAKWQATLLTAFGLLAIALSTVGLYGVVAYVAAQRTQEIGVRMALGAQQSDVLSMVLGHGLRLAVAGVLLGLAISAGLTQLLTRFLFGVSTFDPLDFSATVLVWIAIAALASYIPARRATKVDPVVALRYE